MALKRLADLPADADRDNLELQLQRSLGNAFAAAKGFAAAETVEAYNPALELCSIPRILPRDSPRSME